MRRDPLDNAVLTGRVAAFEQNDNLKVVVDQVLLQFDQLNLKRPQGFL